MARIQIENLTFYYRDYYNPVFENVTLDLSTNWRLGLIGRNGRGKTTLLKLLSGDLKPCGGRISTAAPAELFPCPVDEKYPLTMDVMKESIAGLKTMEDEMAALQERTDEEGTDRLQEILSRYLEAQGYQMESLIRKEIFLMGLPEALLSREYASLSGGEKTKLQIIMLFLRRSALQGDALVLLDEPTNHLDRGGKEILRDYLQRKKGFIIVSHEREFLDAVTDHILSINKTSIELEKGNFSTWEKNKAQRELFELRTRDRLLREVRQLQRRSEQTRGWAEEANKQKYAFATNARTNGSRAYMRQARRSEERIRSDLAAKSELLKNYEQAGELPIEQEDTQETVLLDVKSLCFCYGGEPLIEDLSFSMEKGDRIWLKGENGCGKSTLLKLIAGALKPRAGTVFLPDGVKISMACQEPVWNRGLLRELVKDRARRRSIEVLCEIFDLDRLKLGSPIETWSSGECKKLEMARILSEKNQIILLDEPLNYMDVYFRRQLESAVLESEPTLMFVEHDEGFGRRVANKVIEMGRTGGSFRRIPQRE